MTLNAPPSRDPANDDTLQGAFKTILTKSIQRTDDMLPAEVISHDRAKNRVKVRPLIVMLDTNNRIVKRNPVAQVPVLNLGGGGFFVNFNLPPGSLGWIKASDRDISLFLQSYKESKPNTKRMHSFSDALFIPDEMTNYSIDQADSEAMVIQSLDGSVKIALDNSGIRMNAPDIAITADSSIEFTCSSMMIDCLDFTLNASAGASINGVQFSPAGDVVSPGTVSGASGVFGGIQSEDHKHTNGTAQDGNTGGPISG